MPQPFQTGWYEVAPGVKRQIVTVGEKLMLVHVYLAPGATTTRQSHSHEQVSYVVEGLVRYIIGDKEVEVDHGESVAIPPNTPHLVTAVKETMLLEVFTPIREDMVAIAMR